ncbi:MAG TPA: hypothetical protein VNN80_32570 [Polyangiaceae bacterium]|nr:hypothetical protein [Polyangiaceae bacterium]
MSRRGLVDSDRTDAEGSGGPGSRAAQERTPTKGTPAYDVLHVGRTDLVACLGPCLIVVSHTITLAAVEAMGRGLARLTQGQQLACSLSFVERKSGPSTADEERDAITEVVRKHTKSMTGAAVVCEGTGFRATAVRSVVTSIHMASHSSHPSKVFPETQAALEWLQSTRPRGDLDLALLTESTNALRARLSELMARTTATDLMP